MKVRAREHRPPGGMNRTETRFAEFLEGLRLGGEIRRWEFESHRLKLGDRLHFTPDFWVVDKDGFEEFYDTKATRKDGRVLVEDDALAKIKAAARIYPEYRFAIVAWDAGKGLWVPRTFEPE